MSTCKWESSRVPTSGKCPLLGKAAFSQWLAKDMHTLSIFWDLQSGHFSWGQTLLPPHISKRRFHSQWTAPISDYVSSVTGHMWCESSVRLKRNQCGYWEAAECSVLQPTAHAGLLFTHPTYLLSMPIFMICWNPDPGQQELPHGHHSLVLYFKITVIKDNEGVKNKFVL